MKVWLAKKGRGFLPADDDSVRAHARLAEAECVLCEMTSPRSLQWHRMYFGICSEIGKNQDPPRGTDSIDYELRVRAGHFDVMMIGEDSLLKRIAQSLDVCVEQIRKNIVGMAKFAASLQALADALHERATKLEVRIPKRIAFHKLDGDGWAKLWPSLELAIRETFGEEYLRESQTNGSW